jgi:hypothetical protein
VAFNANDFTVRGLRLPVLIFQPGKLVKIIIMQCVPCGRPRNNMSKQGSNAFFKLIGFSNHYISAKSLLTDHKIPIWLLAYLDAELLKSR